MANFNPQDYETVDSRIHRFYGDHPEGRITTELVDFSGDVGKTRWIVKASVWRSNVEAWPDGTGYAFENDGDGMANRTSALENCETSAIGRALANIGYSGDKRASREEMTKARPEAKPAQVSPPEGWEKKVAAVESVEALQDLYDGEAHQWYTAEVKAAFVARKKELQGADA